MKAGWNKAGLYPFNPGRVLKNIQKPLAKLTILKADEVHFLQNEILQTPITAEGVITLQNLIEQDAHTLDEASKQRVLRAEKLANAAQASLAELALL
jgi:hypothetical protein